jgi:hypothetical protein
MVSRDQGWLESLEQNLEQRNGKRANALTTKKAEATP